QESASFKKCACMPKKLSAMKSSSTIDQSCARNASMSRRTSISHSAWRSASPSGKGFLSNSILTPPSIALWRVCSLASRSDGLSGDAAAGGHRNTGDHLVVLNQVYRIEQVGNHADVIGDDAHLLADHRLVCAPGQIHDRVLLAEGGNDSVGIFHDMA